MQQHDILDPHLNLFRRFGLPPGGQEYENNVTHALINALRLSDPRATRVVLTELVPEIASLPLDWTDIAMGLQRPPRSPAAFQNRVVLGISIHGYTASPIEPSWPQAPSEEFGLESNDTESASPDEQSAGIPDAWIYTKESDVLCLLIEVKTRGGINPHQIQRHEHTHFADRGVTIRNLDLRWRSVSHAIYRAYGMYPNAVIAELLLFLSLEGLAATFRFDDATIRLAGGKLPRDVSEDLAQRLCKSLRLDSENLITWPDWQSHAIIFRSFDAVGNIEIWLDGEPPDVNVRTLISIGTATPRPRHNRLTMPDQITRILANLEIPEKLTRCAETIRATTDHHLFWTVLDRLQRIQSPDWGFRDASKIAELLRAAGQEPASELSADFGEDHPMPGDALERVARGLKRLHRAGEIRGGEFSGFRIYARAYLADLLVPAYGRALKMCFRRLWSIAFDGTESFAI